MLLQREDGIDRECCSACTAHGLLARVDKAKFGQVAEDGQEHVVMATALCFDFVFGFAACSV